MKKQTKINLLLKSPKSLFHTQDLALLWDISNRNTLHTTIKRYVQKGALIRIHRGFYSKKSLDQIDPVKLGIAFLHSYSYLSMETILSKTGVISQAIPYITLVSGYSRKFKIKNHFYISRQMKDIFLFNEAGIIEKNGIKQATLERAVADMLYFNPRYHFDASNLVDWEKVKELQKTIGYK